MSQSKTSSWLVGGAVALFGLVIFGLWYHYLGPGSVPPPPTSMRTNGRPESPAG